MDIIETFTVYVHMSRVKAAERGYGITMSYNPDFAKLTPNELIDFLRGELDGAADNVDYLLSWVYAVACMRDDARREVDSLRAKLEAALKEINFLNCHEERTQRTS